MKKYFYKKDGEMKELHFGDTFVIRGSIENKYGTISTVTRFDFTKFTLPVLLYAGIVFEKDVKDVDDNLTFHSVNTEPVYFLRKIATKLGLNQGETIILLKELHKVYPSYVEDIILKEIALEFDRKYKNHIKDCNKIWYINKFDNSTVYTTHFTQESLTKFAGFRCLSDIETAQQIWKECINKFFHNEKKSE